MFNDVNFGDLKPFFNFKSVFFLGFSSLSASVDTSVNFSLVFVCLFFCLSLWLSFFPVIGQPAWCLVKQHAA